MKQPFSSVDLLMSDGLLKKGKYALFTLPGETDWVIIFNKKWDQWGAYSYDEKDDALRMTLKPLRGRDFAERMTFSFEEDSLAFHWEYLQFSIPLQPAN
ncbi:MAG: DUF2911 domain-containing protein [Cyclobacteriaceae bacterium]|nr:DUF2911 domain-containing protein [Cyclobacteriaceae bacterium]